LRNSYAVGGADNPKNYRITTLGHNTLTFNGQNQPVAQQWCMDPSRRSEGACKLGTGTIASFNTTSLSSSPSGGSSGVGVFTVINLDMANGDPAAKAPSTVPVARWRRGIATIPNSAGSGFAGVVVVDEFNATASFHDVTWSMHTHATVTVDVATESSPARATLNQNGQSLTVQLVSSSGLSGGATASFTTVAVPFASPLLPDPGVSRLQLAFTGASAGATQRLVVALTESGSTPIPATRPLSEWSESGPFVDGLQVGY
jgi:hypothetical protein